MAQLPQREHRELTGEEEIQALEAKLAEKRRELAAQEAEAPPEKEVFREVLREHVADVRISAPPPDASQPLAAAAPATPAGDASAAEREETVRSLIETALTKSVAEAVKDAEAQSPYLLDELHDHLVDEYYEKLVQLRKINPS